MLDVLLSKNLQQDNQGVGPVYAWLKWILLFRLFQRNRIYWVRNIFDFFYAVSVVQLVFAPNQDQHHIDSFYRHYVKQSKRKSLLEHFLVARRWYVSRIPSKLLISQGDVQLGYELNEACCRKLLQYLKNKYYIF